ncbi:MAG: hypothetical protein KDJ16_18720, partial [Hyphomicrobiales bacterium]|nr:hypothetical protein [Hyphomicrobiales bacterium]
MNRVSSAVVGIGEVPSGKYPERSELEAALAVSRQAILDAGLSPRDIDMILPVGALASSHWNVDLVFSRLCEELGMLRSVKMNCQVMAGGATSSSALTIADALIASGQARRILVVHSDAVGSLPKQRGI